jgi:serine/threonine-protein kinase
LSLPDGVNVLYGLKPSVAMSPNGTTVVFRGTKDGIARLYRQTLDGGEAAPIPGTEGGSGPFFSPDGQWIGFFARTALKKIPTTGGTPVQLCFASPVARGATWTADGTILFSRTPNQGLFRVSDQGGAVEVYSKLDAGRGEHAHQWPQALPRGRGTLVTIVRGQDFQDMASAQIVALEPGTLARHVIIEGSSFARYVDAGRLVFIRGRTLYSIPFDLDRLVTTGEPTPVPGDPMVDDVEGIAHFASAGGALVTVAGAAPGQKLTEVLLADRKGAEQRLPLPAGSYMHPTLSPDGKRVVLAKFEQTRGKLFVYDRDRQVLAPLTPEPGRYFAPVWSPDGDRIAFSQYNSSQPRIAWKSADGSGEIQTPASQDTDAEFPSSWSADGKFIAYVLTHPAGQTGPDNIGILELGPSPVKRLWLAGPGDKSAPVFSPDGRWIAYVSNETGQNEVYLRPFTGTAGKIKISRDGGSEPVWNRDGRELVYRSGDDFLSVPLSASDPPLPGAPVLLFSGRFNHGGREDWPREYDMSAGGNAFLLTRSPETPDTRRPLLIMTRWADSPGNPP